MYLEESTKAVIKASAIPQMNLKGFFLTITTYRNGREIKEWIESLEKRGKYTSNELEPISLKLKGHYYYSLNFLLLPNVGQKPEKLFKG